jgi:hypothetical protein
MGADFIGTFCKVTRTRQEAFAALDEIPDSRLVQLLDDCVGGGELEQLDEPAAAVGVGARTFFAAQLAEFYDRYLEGHRQADIWQIDGSAYVVTGGLSWGDSPTDTFDTITNVAALGVTS